jgi:hypothetical protein
MSSKTQSSKPKPSRLGAAAALSKPTTPITVTKPTKIIKPKVGGRPPRTPYARLHITIDRGLADNIADAWRTHKRLDGSPCDGPSHFLEDLTARHFAPQKQGAPETC